MAAVVGGLLVILVNELNDRRKRRADEAELDNRNAALMTAVFAIRNFIVESLNNDELLCLPGTLGALETARRSLDGVIDKAPPETQYVIISAYEISLRLGDVVALVSAGEPEVGLVATKVERLMDAIGQFDLFADSALQLMSAEEIRAVVSNPEAVPDE